MTWRRIGAKTYRASGDALAYVYGIDVHHGIHVSNLWSWLVWWKGGIHSSGVVFTLTQAKHDAERVVREIEEGAR